ncbi:hypothetical protein D0862_13936 [Hortaea werneckii]|uniref:Uncharacterized protein n=1 Tax=Hortaea werneckii TaxID=91943 RepID=A0A3M7EFS4_HORWE|nr:hypothetical protein D0862_13936 [Hortaea werneckii]
MPPVAVQPPTMLHTDLSHAPPPSTTTITTASADSGLDSPIESLSAMSIHDTASTSTTLPKTPAPLVLPRPDMSARSATDPSPSALLQNYFATTHLHEQQSLTTRRNRSPYSRSHLRSRSGGSSALSAPPITRAKSLPTQHTPRSSSMTSNRSSSDSTRSNSGSASPALAAPLSGSPARSPRRLNSPFRDDAPFTTSPPPPRSPSFSGGTPAIESIQEDSELDITPRQINTLPQPPNAAAMTSFSRSGSLRRRPASPLHSLQNNSHPTPPTSTPTSSYPSSPGIRPSHHQTSPAPPSTHHHQRQPSLERFRDEPHPTTTSTTPHSLTLHHYSSTSSLFTSSSISIPSTPTSARSRSPSISSLETIEDAPDLESEAVEMERKIAVERAARIARGEEVVADEYSSSQDGGGGAGTGLWRRRSLDAPGGSSSFGRGAGGATTGVGARVPGYAGAAGAGGGAVERKRWSICGGERRADLDLETIWED